MRNINQTLLGRARTSIFIAHRLRTIVDCGACLLALYFLPMLTCVNRSFILYAYSPWSPAPRHVTCALTFPATDLIIVLDDGQVTEQGTHEELMRAGGLYYRLWQEQAADIFVEESSEPVE